MSKQPTRIAQARASLFAALPMLLLLDCGAGAVYGQQATPPQGLPPTQKPADQEFALRGQRAAREIKYSDWNKFCFKTPGSNVVCRTTIQGTFETGQSAVRIDVIEREGAKAERLQMFLPVGLYLQAGVKVTIDQGTPYRIPYVWCLTNTCIAANLADPNLLKEMESGKKLVLEVVDSNVVTVSTSLPLDHFATAQQGDPARTFEQPLDE